MIVRLVMSPVPLAQRAVMVKATLEAPSERLAGEADRMMPVVGWTSCPWPPRAASTTADATRRNATAYTKAARRWVVRPVRLECNLVLLSGAAVYVSRPACRTSGVSAFGGGKGGTGDGAADADAGGVIGMLAHHAYDHIMGFGIAFVGLLLIIWAERRAKTRRRSGRKRDTS